MALDTALIREGDVFIGEKIRDRFDNLRIVVAQQIGAIAPDKVQHLNFFSVHHRIERVFFGPMVGVVHAQRVQRPTHAGIVVPGVVVWLKSGLIYIFDSGSGFQRIFEHIDERSISLNDLRPGDRALAGFGSIGVHSGQTTQTLMTKLEGLQPGEQLTVDLGGPHPIVL